MKPMGRCKNFAMSTRANRAKKKRLAEPSPPTPSLRENHPPAASPIEGARERLLDSIEHPLILIVLLIIGGFVGVIYFTPALVICEACILLALHGSKILNGRGTAIQATVYGTLFLITGAALVGLSIVARQPARDYLHQMASRTAAGPQAPDVNVPPRSPANPILPPGGFFNFPTRVPNVQNPPANHAAIPPDEPPPPPPNSVEAALMQEMRERLTRDAGDPEKINADVQWMREQFEAGWSLEPPELANKHRGETEETARLILANASNREAVLKIIPHITIDAVTK